MRSSDFLFRLIKALSKGDRRNLKLFGRLQDGDKKYLQLFDAIDAQEEYDEAALLEQFKEERFAKQFSVAKNYLYNYILRTLHVFHHDAHADLSVLLHQIEILMGKNLYDQAQKLVRKAKHMATAQERFQELLYLLDHERKILFHMERTREYEFFTVEIGAAESHVLRQIDNLQVYQHLIDKLYPYVKKGQLVKGSNDWNQLEEILNHQALKDPAFALSDRAKLKRLGVLVDCHYCRNEIELSLEYSRMLIDMLKDNSVLRLENNTRYINTVSNYGVYAYMIGRKAEAMESVEMLRSIETLNAEEEVRVFEMYYNFKIALAIELGDKAAGLKTIADFEAESKEIDGQIRKSVELSIYYLSAYFYFVVGMPEAALHWVNQLLNEPRTELRLDLQCAARQLNLLIHFELGNWDLLEYMMKSTVRFLTNRNRLTDIDRLMLKHIRLLINQSEGQLTPTSYLYFQEELGDCLNKESNRQLLKTLDLSAWLESKVNGTLMTEIIQRNSVEEIPR